MNRINDNHETSSLYTCVHVPRAHLVVVSLDTAGLLAAVCEAGAGQVHVVAHVHPHPLLHRGGLHYHAPRTWTVSLKMRINVKLKPFCLTCCISGESWPHEV